MNQKSYILAGLLLASGATMAQLPERPIEVGLKGGATFVHGFTTIPAQPTSIVGVQVPQIDNKNNGIGMGYSAGAFVRFNKYNRKGYVQIELTYNRYLLKQKTNLTLDVNANPALAAYFNGARRYYEDMVANVIDQLAKQGKRLDPSKSPGLNNRPGGSK